LWKSTGVAELAVWQYVEKVNRNKAGSEMQEQIIVAEGQDKGLAKSRLYA
jgi:hypothetical protein